MSRRKTSHGMEILRSQIAASNSKRNSKSQNVMSSWGGKKWFAFSKMDMGAMEMLARLEVGG